MKQMMMMRAGVVVVIAGTITALSGLGVAASSDYNTTPFNEFKKSQVTALFRESEGYTLEGIFRAQGLQIKYNAPEDKLSASVIASSALEEACNAEEVARQPICQEYSQIPTDFAAQAEINSKHKGKFYTGLGFALGGSVVMVGGFTLAMRSRLSKPKEILPVP